MHIIELFLYLKSFFFKLFRSLYEGIGHHAFFNSFCYVGKALNNFIQFSLNAVIVVIVVGVITLDVLVYLFNNTAKSSTVKDFLTEQINNVNIEVILIYLFISAQLFQRGTAISGKPVLAFT